MQDTKNQENHRMTKKKTHKANARRFLVHRRKTAVVLSVASTLVLAGIGFDVVSNSPHEKNVSPPSYGKMPLRVLADEEDNDIAYNSGANNFESEVNIIQFLTHQKNLQAQKIRELKEELETTETRLRQLKADILIRGGEKEQKYQSTIATMQQQISNLEGEMQHLRSEVAARDRLLESKRSELENITKIFTETNHKLESSLAEATQQQEENRTKANRLFKELKGYLLRHGEDESLLDNMDIVLQRTRSRLEELEQNLYARTMEADQEKTRADNLALAVEQKHFELVGAQETINGLIERLRGVEEKNETLRADLIAATSSSTTSNEPYEEDIELLKTLLAAEDGRAEYLQEELQKTKEDLISAEDRARELEEELGYMRGTQVGAKTSYGSGDSIAYADDTDNNVYYGEKPSLSSATKRMIAIQQEKLIKDLEKSLSEAEKKNQKLEDQIKELKSAAAHNSSPAGSRQQQIFLELQQRLRSSENRVKELEQQLEECSKAEPAKINKASTPSTKDRSAQEDRDIEQLKKQLSRAQLENETLREEYQRALHDRDEALLTLQDKLYSSQYENPDVIAFDETKHLHESLSQSQVAQQQHIDSLEEELVWTKDRLRELESGMASVDERYYAERISILEQAFEAQRDSLLAAQQELLELTEEREQQSHGHGDMEKFYLAQLESIKNKNQILEEQLEEAEDYLKMTQDQLVTHQHKSMELEGLLAQREHHLRDLELQISMLDGTGGYFQHEGSKQSLESVSNELEQEKQRRLDLEKMVAALQSQLAAQEKVWERPSKSFQQPSTSAATTKALEDQVKELRKQYQSEKDNSKNLEERLEVMSRWARRLQDELNAYDKANRVYSTPDPSKNAEAALQGSTDPTVKKLQAKISYLTTRLSQEQARSQEAEEQLHEIKLQNEEILDRNSSLETMLHKM